MFRTVTATILCFSLACAPSLSVAAGSGGGGNKDKSNGESTTRGPKKQLATIVFAGVAGAIMGLSTLSFYGRPQDKLNNIAIGAAIGIIGGTIYSTFKAASDPHEFYGGPKPPAGTELWALEEKARNRDATAAAGGRPGLGLKFSF